MFGWNITHKSIDYTPITIIKNAINKKKCKEISEQILEFKKSEEANEHAEFNRDSNPGCWRGFPNLAPPNSPGLSEENKELIFNTIMQSSVLYRDNLPIADGLKSPAWNSGMYDVTRLQQHAWFNVNEPNASNQIHNHTGSFFSGVLYFRATGTGKIRFYPNNHLIGYSHPLWPYKGVYLHYPEDGDLILFPAHLLHEVEPNPSNELRINTAFNISVPIANPA